MEKVKRSRRSWIANLRAYMETAHAQHPPVPMTFAGTRMGLGDSVKGGIYVHCGNAREIAEHVAKVANMCPWVTIELEETNKTEWVIRPHVISSAPGLEGGPTHRKFEAFALVVIKRSADVCHDLGSRLVSRSA